MVQSGAGNTAVRLRYGDGEERQVVAAATPAKKQKAKGQAAFEHTRQAGGNTAAQCETRAPAPCRSRRGSSAANACAAQVRRTQTVTHALKR
jgi:hypothetical protein